LEKCEKEMLGSKLTLKLTYEQQTQIKDATGKKISELSIDLVGRGHLTERKEELQQVAGGTMQFPAE
jgi:hypothetical protein